MEWLRLKQNRLYRQEDLVNLNNYYEFNRKISDIYDFTNSRDRLQWLGRFFPHMVVNEKWETHMDIINKLPAGGVYIGTRAGGQNFSRLTTGRFSSGVIVEKSLRIISVFAS